ENFREGNHTLICNCCACCCNLIGGITKWDNPRAVAKANYIATLEKVEDCTACGTCIEKCNFNAITIESNIAVVNDEKCMGCGVCVVNCPNNAITLKRIEREVIYKDLIELGLKVAKETNKEIKLF
ncbi:MAG: 4Fe-4S dicluster domain-containing protein, partial [Candidatus Helarchaeota archaeon]